MPEPKTPLEEIVSKLKARTATVESKVQQLESRVVVQESHSEALADWRIEVDEKLDALTDAPSKQAPIEWWTVTETEVAALALVDVHWWVDAVYRKEGGEVHHDCWPLHGRFVNELLSLRAMHRKALKTRGPDDWSAYRKLQRETIAVITDWKPKCGVGRHEMLGGMYTFEPTQLDLIEIADTWCKGKLEDGTIPRCLTLRDEDER